MLFLCPRLSVQLRLHNNNGFHLRQQHQRHCGTALMWRSHNMAMLSCRGDEAARRKEYTLHLVEHLELLLTELAAERQRFAAPQPPGTPGNEAHAGRSNVAGGQGQPDMREGTTTMPRRAGWVDVDVRSLCSACARSNVSH